MVRVNELIIVSLDGILRESGSRSVITEVMIQLGERGEFVPTLAHQDDHYAIAVALKRYCRELQGRIIPCSFVEEFNQSQSVSSEDLKVMFSRLDSIAFETAKYVFGFLVQITALSDVNRMTAANVAITTGPSLVDVDNSDVDSIKSCLPLTEAILRNYHDIFPTPEGTKISLTVLVSVVTPSSVDSITTSMLASCSEPKTSSSTLVSRSASERERDMSTFGAGISSLKQVTSAAVLSSKETLATKAPPIPVRVYTDQQLGLWPRKESSMSGYTSRH